jgi:myosin-5
VFIGLATVAKLLGCTANQLVTAMSTRKIRAGNDSIIKKLTLTQVCNHLEMFSEWIN